MSRNSHRETATHVVIPEKPTTPPPAPKPACDCGGGYQWAFQYRDVIVPCSDEEAARHEVARFSTGRRLVRRRVGPWEEPT